MTETIIVPPWIPANAKLLCVGQSPAKEEAARLRPFVGTDGRQLHALIKETGLDSVLDVAYINVVNEYKGKFNYMPTKKEIAVAHIDIIDGVETGDFGPIRVVVLLGGCASKLQWPDAKITEVQGRRLVTGSIDFIACWHPGAARNARTPEAKQAKLDDSRSVLATAAKIIRGEDVPTVKLPEYRLVDWLVIS